MGNLAAGIPADLHEQTSFSPSILHLRALGGEGGRGGRGEGEGGRGRGGGGRGQKGRDEEVIESNCDITN